MKESAKIKIKILYLQLFSNQLLSFLSEKFDLPDWLLIVYGSSFLEAHL